MLAGWVGGESGSAIINLIYLISVLCVGLSVCECDCVLCAGGGLVVWPQTGAWGFYAVFVPIPTIPHSLVGYTNFGLGPKTKIGMSYNNKLRDLLQ